MKTLTGLVLIIILFMVGSCTQEEMYEAEGKAGSMARFTIQGNFLYAVDYNNLQVFDITNPHENQSIERQHVGFGIETIFPSNNHLFLGARNGMYIYSLENPQKPVQISFTPHFVAYDPVVVQGNIAYVTLRQDNSGGWGNLLQIYDISKLSRPVLLEEYEMWGPRGLGVDGDMLFICDDKLEVFRIISPGEIELVHSFDIQAIDVIPRGNILYVVSEDGFYQFNYEQGNLSLISKITLTP